MPNLEAVNIVRRIKDPHKAAKQLTIDAYQMDSLLRCQMGLPWTL